MRVAAPNAGDDGPFAWTPTERAIARVRVALLTITTIVYYLAFDRADASPRLATLTLAFAWAYSIGVALGERYIRDHLKVARIVLTIADTLVAVAWFEATGGLQSPWSVTLYVGAMSIALRFGLAAAIAGGAAYGLLYFGVCAHHRILAAHTATIVAQVTHILAVSTLAGVLSRVVVDQRGRAAKAWRLVRASSDVSCAVQSTHAIERLVEAAPYLLDAEQAAAFLQGDHGPIAVARASQRTVVAQTTAALLERMSASFEAPVCEVADVELDPRCEPFLATLREQHVARAVIYRLEHDGERLGIFGVFRDRRSTAFTDADVRVGRRLAEDAANALYVQRRMAEMRERIDQYATLVKALGHLGEGVAVVEPGTERIRSINEGVPDITGFTPDELFALPSVLALLAPEERAVLAERMRSPTPDADRPHNCRLFALHKSGERRRVEVAIAPLDDRTRSSFVVVLRDVTEQTRLEDERDRALLREQLARATAEAERARLVTILEAAPNAIVFCSSGGRVMANARALQLLGPIPAAGARERLATLLNDPTGQPLPSEAQPLERALRGEQVANLELLVVAGTARVEVIASAAPVSALSETVGAVVALQDISQLRALERYRERYVELVSHDLRSPLTTIGVRSTLLSRALAAKGLHEEARHADVVLRCGHRMNAMIQDLLDSTHIEAGRMSLHLQPVDLSELLIRVMEQVVSPEDRERVRVEQSGTVRSALVDADRIERVVVNLVSNSLKYSPPESLVLIRLHEERDYAVVTVVDQGPGIAAADQPHVFERYYRGDRSGATEGLGLGLYISRMIVHSHGGELRVSSEVGRGSQFTFTLPFAAVEAIGLKSVG